MYLQLDSGELFLLRRASQRSGRSRTGCDHLGKRIEVSGSHEALVLDGLITVLCFAGELLFLQAGVRGHAVVFITARQFEHAQVQGMESGQSDELELVSHPGKLTLEVRDGPVVEVFLPVERWRTVIRQQFFRIPGMDRFCEASSPFYVGMRSFAPDQVGVGRVR